MTLLDIIRLILNAIRNNANAEGHRESLSCDGCRSLCTYRATAAVEVCLACCAECIVGCIEGMVQYFNR